MARLLSLLLLLSLSNLSKSNAFTIPVNREVSLQTAPLIGGPSWLPVHVKVVVQGDHIFDFVPLNPTSQDTLKSLVSLRPVPAEARIRRQSQPASSPGQRSTICQRGVQFCEDYNKDLHLIRNNCWGFAYELVKHLSSESSCS